MLEFIQQVANGLFTGSAYALVAMGFGLVFSAMRVINLAHPDLMMIGAYISFLILSLASDHVAGPVVVLLLAAVLITAAACTALIGLVLERTVIRPLRGSNIMIPFIATAGISIALQGSAQWIFGPDPRGMPSLFPSASLVFAGIIVSVSQLVTLMLAIAVTVVVAVYMRWTKWGRATRAVAELPDIASASGINVTRVYQLSIGVASAMAGVAGVTIGLLYSSASPYMGLLFGLKSFVCMLVAGNRNLEGIALVGLTLGVTEALVAGYVSSSFRDAIAFALLLLVLIARPSGLFGSYGSLSR